MPQLDLQLRTQNIDIVYLYSKNWDIFPKMITVVIFKRLHFVSFFQAICVCVLYTDH